MSDKRKPKLVATGGMFIDPTDSGSTVMYKIVDDGYNLDGIVNLTDYSRMICWYFDCNDAGIKKIDNAIDVLQKLKKEINLGKKIQEAYDAKKKKEEASKKDTVIE